MSAQVTKEMIDKRLSEYKEIYVIADTYWYELDDGPNWWKGDWYKTLDIIKTMNGMSPSLTKKIFGRDPRKACY